MIVSEFGNENTPTTFSNIPNTNSGGNGGY